MIRTTVVSGGSAAQREAAIAARVAALPTEARVAMILEGPPADPDPLRALAAVDTRVALTRIAAGCPCCSGNLALRVTLDRTVRRRPSHLFLGLASNAHLLQLRGFLQAPPYDGHLALDDDLRLQS